MSVKDGDDFIFLRYRGERVDIGGCEYVVMSNDDVLAVISLPEKSKGWFELSGGSSSDMDHALENARVKD